MSWLQKFDERYNLIIQSLPESLQPLMKVLTLVGQPLLVIASGFSLYIVASKNNNEAVLHVVVYAVVAFIVNNLVKLLLHRSRPHGLVIKNLGVKSYSFPSGHAFGTVIFYGEFAILAVKYWSHPLSLITAGIIWALIFMIGISRVYLGAHYPSDVLAGWLLGGISLVVINSLAF
jgi:undecaprenyl-diphosphatase